MKNTILILCLINLTVLSCGILSAGLEPTPEPSERAIQPTVSLTNSSLLTNTPEDPTSTLLPTFTKTPELNPSPTVIEPAMEIHDLPLMQANQPITITQINMQNTTHGWAIGHQIGIGDRILYTLDGGLLWEDRTPPVIGSIDTMTATYRAWGYFHDPEIAWVIQMPQDQPPPIPDPVVWRTQDAGQNWQPSTPLSLTGIESFFVPEQFTFINPNQGWLLVHVDAGMSHDYSLLFTTSDGGKFWQRLVDPHGIGLQSLHNTGIAFADSEFGWVTKDNLGVMPGAFIEQTQDSGLSWDQVFLPAPKEHDWFNELSQCETSNPFFFEPARGIILVNCRTLEGATFTYTYTSSDKGQSWLSATLPIPIRSLFFIDDQFGWIFGRDIFQSTDGGLSWVKIKTVTWDGQFNFVDRKTGWAVASSDSSKALVYTQDSGRSWQIIQPTLK